MITNIITNNDIVQSHTDNVRPELPMKEGTKSETSAYSIDDNIEKYIAIGIVAVIGVVGCVLIIKKEK